MIDQALDYLGRLIDKITFWSISIGAQATKKDSKHVLDGEDGSKMSHKSKVEHMLNFKGIQISRLMNLIGH